MYTYYVKKCNNYHHDNVERRFILKIFIKEHEVLMTQWISKNNDIIHINEKIYFLKVNTKYSYKLY